MNLWQKFFGKGEVKAASIVPAAGLITGVSGNARLLTANDDDLKQSTVLQACLMWAQRYIIDPDLILEEKTVDGWGQVEGAVADKALFPILNRIERSTQTTDTLIQGLCYSLMIRMDAFGFFLRNGKTPVAIEYIPGGDVTVLTEGMSKNILAGYEISGVGKRPAEDILHVRWGVNEDTPLEGPNPMIVLSRAIGADVQGQAYSFSILKKPSPGGIVTVSDEAANQKGFVEGFKRLLKNATSGDNAGDFVVTQAEHKFSDMSFSPEKMALTTLLRLPEERICAFYGISPAVVGLGAGKDTGLSGGSKYEEQQKSSIRSCLVPIWTAIERALSAQLLPQLGLDPAKYRYRFKIEELSALQEDKNALVDRVSKMYRDDAIDRYRYLQLVGEVPSDADKGVYFSFTQMPLPTQQMQKAMSLARQVQETL